MSLRSVISLRVSANHRVRARTPPRALRKSCGLLSRVSIPRIPISTTLCARSTQCARANARSVSHNRCFLFLAHLSVLISRMHACAHFVCLFMGAASRAPTCARDRAFTREVSRGVSRILPPFPSLVVNFQIFLCVLLAPPATFIVIINPFERFFSFSRRDLPTP